jgi:hypothetical protein
MLRGLAVLLLLANLLFFAWARGWLSPVLPPPHHGEREPERLAAQLRPETVKLLTPQAASAAVAAAATACVEAGPFSDSDAATAEAALAAASVPAGAWVRRSVEAPPAWLVYMGRFTDPATMRTKQDELRRLKIGFDEVRAPAELAPGLALSHHDSREAANAALAQMAQRGVHTARVVALAAPPALIWLRADKADSGLRARLQALKPPQIAAAFAACAGSRP